MVIKIIPFPQKQILILMLEDWGGIGQWEKAEPHSHDAMFQGHRTPFKNTPTSWDQRISAWQQKKVTPVAAVQWTASESVHFWGKVPSSLWMHGTMQRLVARQQSEPAHNDFHMTFIWDQSGSCALELNCLLNPYFLLVVDTTVLQLCCTHRGARRVSKFNFSLCIANENSYIHHGNLFSEHIYFMISSSHFSVT